MLISFGTGIIISIVGPTVPAMAVRLHVRESSLGLVFGANFLTASASTFPAGRALDRFGPRLLLPAGLFAMALGALGEGAAPSLALLAVASALAGAGIGVMNVGTNAAAGALYPERREAVLNALNVLFGIGAFLAPLLVDGSLTRLGDYTPAYMLTCILLALPAPLLLLGLSGSREERAIAPAAVRALLTTRALWAPMAIGFLYLGAEIGFGGWIVAIVQRLAHLDASTAGPVASLFWLSLALGGIPTAVLLRRGVAPIRLIAGGAVVAAGASAALALCGSLVAAAVAACALVGLSFAPIFPLTLALTARAAGAVGPHAAASATALVLVAAQVGAAVIPPAQGLLLQGGPGAALGVTCACSLLMAALARAYRAR